MSSKRIHRWVFELITKFYPRFYFRRHDPIVRPPRKPIRLDIDLLDRRESPTNLSPVGPGSAWLAPFLRAAEPLPALAQTAPNPPTPFPTREGGEVFLTREGGVVFRPSPLRGGVGGEVLRAEPGNDGATSTPTPMPWHFAASAFAINLDPISSGQALVQDPFTLDALLQSKPPSRLSFPPNTPSPLGGEGPGEGASSSSTGGGGGSSTESGQGSGASSGGDSAPGIPSLNLPSPLVGEPQVTGAGRGSSAPGFHGSGSAGNPGNPSQPNPGHGHGHHHKDAFYVLDANKAIVVTPGTTDNEFSNTAMDLRMQVSAATVSSYSWDYSGAHDVTGVSGGSTYNLTFSWTSFTGAARSETIIAKETPQGGGQVTQTLTFLVAGTNSPAWSTIPTSWSTWSTFPVMTPDTLSAMQASQCCGSYADLGLTAGDLQYAHSLPAYNPGVPPTGLVYNSVAANTLPIFITHFQIDPSQAVPPAVKAQLTFNSVAGSWVWYDTSHLNPGDIIKFPSKGMPPPSVPAATAGRSPSRPTTARP